LLSIDPKSALLARYGGQQQWRYAGSSAVDRVGSHDVRWAGFGRTGPSAFDRVGIRRVDGRLSDLDCDRVRQRRIRADGAEYRPDAHQPFWNLPLADLERKDLAGNANSPIIRRSGAFGCLDGGALLVHLDGNEPRLF